MNMKNVIVIGGSGFIGTRLCQRFSQSLIQSFTIVDKVLSPEFPANSIKADVRSKNDLMIDPISGFAIINLAAEHRDDVRPLSLYDEVNVNGASNVCEMARAKGISKLIFTSSVAIYGFAPIGTDEHGEANPFNDYGRTKWEAEKIYKEWQQEDPENRVLVILRPTVIFGESNRGNVFNLLRQIATGKFLMIGDGLNRKSMAYVENVAAFIEYALSFESGIHIYNYIDKPDFSMNELVGNVNVLLGRPREIKYRLPFAVGLMIGRGFDILAKLSRKKFPISAIRVKKFCSNSVFESSIKSTGFQPPVPLIDAIKRTVRFEFIENKKSERLFFSE